jgi:hypothetical protein
VDFDFGRAAEARARRRTAERLGTSQDAAARPVTTTAAPGPARAAAGPFPAPLAPPPANRPRASSAVSGGPALQRPGGHAAPAASRWPRQPDRIALWAVVLGIFLVALAAASSRADASTHASGAAAPAAALERTATAAAAPQVTDVLVSPARR